MTDQKDILLAGGYGTVGRRVAALLAEDYPNRVVVAGRDAMKAEHLARELGHGMRGRWIDVDAPATLEASLEGVGTVVACIDQKEAHLLNAAIAHGLAYTDIAPHSMTRRPTPQVQSLAAQTGARVILGAGLAPGISSMLARRAADHVGQVLSVESNVLLSVGDEYGTASRSYLMEELSLAYSVRIDGRLVSVRPFATSARVSFPLPLGPRTAYSFPFSDQVFYPQTLGAATSIARLALNPPWLGSVLSVLLRLSVPALMKKRAGARERFNRLNMWLQQKYAGLDWYGLVVEARGVHGVARIGLVGRGQAEGTAIGAALIARALAEGEVEEAGVWLAEQVVPADRFFERLAALGLVPTADYRLNEV